jgi:hypothetical protein
MKRIHTTSRHYGIGIADQTIKGFYGSWRWRWEEVYHYRFPYSEALLAQAKSAA